MSLDRSLLGQIRLVGTRQSGRGAAVLAVWPLVYSCCLTVIARDAVSCLHAHTSRAIDLRAGFEGHA